MKIAVISDRPYDFSEYLTDDIECAYYPSSFDASPRDWFAFDAAFLLEPYDPHAQIVWTGHPHLRSVSAVEKLPEELRVLSENTERERKFLVAYPDWDALAKYHPFCSHIEQTYLLNENATHRLRIRKAGDTVVYYETIKIRITGAKCTEIEHRITKEEYNELLPLADPSKHPIVKDRYCFLYEGQYFELDVYPFWRDKAVVEVELNTDDQPVTLPAELSLIAEVTDDVKYKNNHLASVTNYDHY